MELKCAGQIKDFHQPQLLIDTILAGTGTGLFIDFNVRWLGGGIKHHVLSVLRALRVEKP